MQPTNANILYTAWKEHTHAQTHTRRGHTAKNVLAKGANFLQQWDLLYTHMISKS